MRGRATEDNTQYLPLASMDTHTNGLRRTGICQEKRLGWGGVGNVWTYAPVLRNITQCNITHLWERASKNEKYMM